MSDAGYLGGFDRLQQFAKDAQGRPSRAARAAAAAAEELRALAEKTERPSVQLQALLAFLGAHDRLLPAGDELRERHLRARSAIVSAIQALRRAHEQLDDEKVSLAEIAGMMRRWIEGPDVCAAHRHERCAGARRASGAVRRVRRDVSRRINRRRVAAASEQKHFLSTVAAQPARLARFPGRVSGRARGVSRSARAAAPADSSFDVRARERLNRRSERVFGRPRCRRPSQDRSADAASGQDLCA